MTDFTKADLSVVLPDIDRKRVEMHMSYQAMADACDVSQTTIIRVIKRQVSPTYELLQKMAAAVRYEPQIQVVLPKDYTQEAYITYLRELITKQRGDYERQFLQQEAQFNRIHSQDRRLVRILSILLGVFAAAFILFRAVDLSITRDLAEEVAIDVCEACFGEITDHSDYCSWCGHKQVSEIDI